jgi:hypothetical protein
MTRNRLLTLITILVIAAIVGGIVLEAALVNPERFDTIPPRPLV